MRSPRMVSGPVLSPGKCFICGGGEGAMLDTMVDIVGDGRFYICERICLPQVAAAAGYVSPDEQEVHLAVAERAALAEQVAELTAALEMARSVTLAPEDVQAIKDLRKAMLKRAAAKTQAPEKVSA